MKVADFIVKNAKNWEILTKTVTFWLFFTKSWFSQIHACTNFFFKNEARKSKFGLLVAVNFWFFLEIWLIVSKISDILPILAKIFDVIISDFFFILYLDAEEYLPNRIVVDGNISTTVTANNPFHIPFKAITTNGTTVTGGVLSKMNAMLQVGFIHKWWKISPSSKLSRLYSTEAQLGGTNWIKSPATHDQVIYQQMSAGQVCISFICLSDTQYF